MLKSWPLGQNRRVPTVPGVSAAMSGCRYHRLPEEADHCGKPRPPGPMPGRSMPVTTRMFVTVESMVSVSRITALVGGNDYKGL